MSFDPQKWFIGLMEFFTILLPGALVTFLLAGDVGPWLLGCQRWSAMTSVEAGFAFLVSSYLVGHFAFLLGSKLLDDVLFDRVEKARRVNQTKRAVQGKHPSLWLTRQVARRFEKSFWRKNDRALRAAERIKRARLLGREGADAINTFQWCKIELSLRRESAGVLAVQRFEADSKFFRSLFVVLCVVVFVWLCKGSFGLAALGLALSPLAFWRFAEQRAKATTQAYWSIIASEARRKHPASSAVEPSEAGGVVVRSGKDGLECLLVRAKSKKVEWVLPKGHLEAAERPDEAAVREILEEAGVWARVRDVIGDFAIPGRDGVATVRFFLLEPLVDDRKPEPGRAPTWLAFPAAIEKATHGETKRVLGQAAEAAKKLWN